MGFLSGIENTVKSVAERPLLPGLFKNGKGKDDDAKKLAEAIRKINSKDGKK